MRKTNYKKRVVTITVSTMLLFALTACGKDKATDSGSSTSSINVDVIESTVENTVEDTTNVNTETTAIETVEETTVESSSDGVEIGDNFNDNRLDEGMAKIYKGLQAYNDLVSHGGTLNEMLQDLVENLEEEKYDLDHPVTKDGLPIQTAMGVRGSLINYYWSYINEDSGYYDIGEWISNQENDDSLFENKICHWNSGVEVTTNDKCLVEFIGIMNFMNQCDQIVGTDVIEADENTPMQYLNPSYYIPLNCDGNTYFIAVFDAGGNLLNVCNMYEGEDYSVYIPTYR